MAAAEVSVALRMGQGRQGVGAGAWSWWAGPGTVCLSVESSKRDSTDNVGYFLTYVIYLIQALCSESRIDRWLGSVIITVTQVEGKGYYEARYRGSSSWVQCGLCRLARLAVVVDVHSALGLLTTCQFRAPG